MGEVLDKISILRIKRDKIKDLVKLKHIRQELWILEENIKDFNCRSYLVRLRTVNEVLWDTEDAIRLKEKDKMFDREFIELARRIYQTNDERFKIKNEVNQIFHSEIQEQKSYERYI